MISAGGNSGEFHIWWYSLGADRDCHGENLRFDLHWLCLAIVLLKELF